MLRLKVLAGFTSEPVAAENLSSATSEVAYIHSGKQTLVLSTLTWLCRRSGLCWPTDTTCGFEDLQAGTEIQLCGEAGGKRADRQRS